MNILLKTIRIAGFRGIKNLELNLSPTTILTGMNNAGKTTFLKALQIALGNRQFISQDDFYITGNTVSNEIIIDTKFIPTNEAGAQQALFDEEWEELFTEDRISTDIDDNNSVLVRTIVSFDSTTKTYKTKQYTLSQWPLFFDESTNQHWYELNVGGNEKRFSIEEIPFFYVDAQRDILEDIRLKGSYLGQMISNIKYTPTQIQDIEQQIEELNNTTISSSSILTNIKDTLEELDTAMSTTGGVEITPFTKKLRDLNKGLSIYYGDSSDSFSMEYHGMGTRSWASLLTLKSLISLLEKDSTDDSKPFFPILAVEEPEAHLHPNAQKNLYAQITSIFGQKIISTHSPYIVASAELSELRSLYKNGNEIACGFIDTDELSRKDKRKIRREVINTRGELFFSKLIVFCEGETEEQAFPIFAEQYFGRTADEMAIDFVGVKGHGYLPFLRVVEGLNIPWLIFSDAETNIVNSVKKQIIDSNTSKNISDVVIFLDTKNSFEEQLMVDGFIDEMKVAIVSIEVASYMDETARLAKKDEIAALSYKGVIDKMKKKKTEMGPAAAQAIVDSGKTLPPKVIELFDKIKAIL
jgi:putative ATP-dependent endonuclease of OLD family